VLIAAVMRWALEVSLFVQGRVFVSLFVHHILDPLFADRRHVPPSRAFDERLQVGTFVLFEWLRLGAVPLVVLDPLPREWERMRLVIGHRGAPAF
jgi:hypothetical protein